MISRFKSALTMIHPKPPPPCSSVAPPAVPSELPLMEIALGVCVAPGVIVAVATAPACWVLKDRAATVTVGAFNSGVRVPM
jgi:hypothetical protein